MKPDSRPVPAAMDLIERAHLVEPGDASHVMYRYPADAGFDGLLQRFWIPVWTVPPGEEAPQRVLQYPVALVVVAADYARFYGVVSGMSTTTLTGSGWAVGVMCAPAAGALVAGGPMSAFTDRHVDLPEVLGAAGEELTARVRAAMAADPHSPEAQGAAMTAFTDALRPFLPIDDDGRLVNEVVAFVEADRDVVRVAQVCERFGLSERALQRLVHRRLGLTPKWLIQRRRLQEAAERLRGNPSSIGEVAALLGYADQAHFSRDFTRATAMTPGRFAATHASGS
ncbi:helix-turn-helix transcriptional regulator [Blastococcus saxobsidens]|uniref:Helix-turn-helix transcriptional regulator n=1 Tax=Blastococcus saxobsidens TaxID=138336 RepID=A0A6L9VXB6_9ACTN|nr:AraC family transcriptional regulator [Blastococcus saxobsidens]NEK84425.1 helix-turn-helix transcriptional regulator [Blastococcus saxobsidens]